MILRSAIRSLTRARGRTLLTVFSILIGTCSFYMMTMITGLVPASIDQSARQMLGGDLALQAYLTPIQTEAISALIPAEQRTAMTAALVKSSMIKSEAKTTNIIVKGVDIRSYPLIDNEQLPGLELLMQDEVILTEDAASRLNVEPGDPIGLPNATDGTLQEFRVKHIVPPTSETYTDASILGMAYLPYEQAITLWNERTGNVNEAWFMLKDPSTAASLKEAIAAQIPGVKLVDLEDKKKELKKESRNLLLFLQFFSLLALFISGITISNTMAVIVVSRLQEVAVMKTIGMRAAAISRYFLAEAAVLGISGLVGGLVLGIIFSRLIASYTASLLTLPLKWHIAPEDIFVTGLAVCGVTGVSSWLAIRRTNSVSPLQLLRDSWAGASKQPSLSFGQRMLFMIGVSLLLGLYLKSFLYPTSAAFTLGQWLLSSLAAFGLLLLAAIFMKVSAFIFSMVYRFIGLWKNYFTKQIYLGFHQLSSAHRRNSVLTVTLTVGIISVIASHIFGENLMAQTKSQLEQQAAGNLYVTSSIQDERETRRILQETSGVESVKMYHQLNGSLQSVNGQNVLPLFAQAAQTGQSFFNSTNLSIQGEDASDSQWTVIEGNVITEEDQGKNKALLLDQYRDVLKIKVGDRVGVRIGEHVEEFEVKGFFKSGIVKTASMLIPSDTLVKVAEPVRVTFSVRVNDEQLSGALSTVNRQLPNSAMAFPVGGQLESLNKMIEFQRTFFTIIAVFAFVIAVITIGNQIIISIMQQTRDIALIKTVGASSGRLLIAILVEYVTVAACAGFAGSIISLLLSALTLSAMLHVPVSLDLIWCFIGIGLAVVTTGTVALLVSMRSLAIKPIQMLR
ncbi:ABC transporter permease [Paenibacillus sp. YYML68]|uniref:ABC transporter permease n=1 Tax=Paenibacillus sp. YYML68 TaxID=2909250 RepID=UPI002490E0C6|nr:FtsX-like permease family protein [Paenibacillus sp. YYML68]